MILLPISLFNGGVAVDTTFGSTWKTDNAGVSNDDQISLPLVSTGTYSFTVDWGDGNEDTITTWDDVAKTHTYASTGTYTVVITGQCEGWKFNGGGDKTKILTIDNWGTDLKLNTTASFSGCSNLVITADDVLALNSVDAGSALFYQCSSLTTIPGIENWTGWGSINTLLWGFRACTNLNEPGIGSIDTSGCAVFTSIFRDSSSFNQPLTWDTGLNTSFSHAFRNATSFDQDIGALDVTALTAAASMFTGVTLSTANYDALLTGWDAQAVLDSVSFNGGSSLYSAGAPATARAALIADHSWSIVDGGAA